MHKECAIILLAINFAPALGIASVLPVNNSYLLYTFTACRLSIVTSYNFHYLNSSREIVMKVQAVQVEVVPYVTPMVYRLLACIHSLIRWS